MSEEREYKRYVLGTNTRFRPSGFPNNITYDSFEKAKMAAELFAETYKRTIYIFERMEVVSLVGEIKA